MQSPGGHSNSDEIDGNEFSEPGAEPGLGTVRTVFNSDFNKLNEFHTTSPASTVPEFSFNNEYKGQIKGLIESRGFGFT